MVIAFNGEDRIESESQLRSLITELPKSNNFGLLLGAGSSKCAGGLLMDEVWDCFKNGFADSYNLLVSEKYMSADDVESNKYQLIAQILDRLNETIKENEMVGNSKFHYAEAICRDFERAFISAAILNRNNWGQPPEKLSESGELSHHIRVLSCIKESRSQGQPAPWYFTLNYDLALEWAARKLRYEVVNGFQGEFKRVFNAESFDLSLINANQNTGNLKHSINIVKLHGSLTWTIKEGEIEELQEIAAFRELKRFLLRQGKSKIPDRMILPSGFLYKKTSKSPHNELLKQFDKFLTKPDTVLIIVGYGHSDAHINDRIHAALSNNKGLKLVVYFPEFTDITDKASLPESLIRIIELKNPDVTIVGGGKEAYFDAFAKHISFSM